MFGRIEYETLGVIVTLVRRYTISHLLAYIEILMMLKVAR